jgi:glycine C-acetyltransferase/8-amino-7-oxononanoate synthase
MTCRLLRTCATITCALQPISGVNRMTSMAMETPMGPRVIIGGRERDYFSGTGYLGLQNHPQVLQAAADALARYGFATATSRGGYGEHPLYAALEEEARAFFGAERVLCYPSGYMSGVVLAQGLAGQVERIFIDEAAHYSLWDGARAAGKPLVPFRHRDPQSLREALRAALRPGERPLVFSDGLFPISGALAPAPEYLVELQEYPGAWLCLDDAHAAGVLGAHGRGTLEHFGVQHAHTLAGHTLSKGIGGYGGLIAGPAALVEMLEMGSRVYVGASPVPLPAAAAGAAALRLARDDALRQALWRNVARARAGLRAAGWPLEESPAPILCLARRPGLDLARLKDALFERNLCVAHVHNYSSTPPGGALRIAIFATHTTQQIDRLVEVIAALA